MPRQQFDRKKSYRVKIADGRWGDATRNAADDGWVFSLPRPGCEQEPGQPAPTDELPFSDSYEFQQKFGKPVEIKER